MNPIISTIILGAPVVGDVAVGGLPNVSSASLVFDFDPAAAGFTADQSVASWAAANDPTIIAAQATGASQPIYRSSSGTNLKPCVEFDGGDVLDIASRPVFKHIFVVADGDYAAEKANDFASIYVAGNGGNFNEYCFVASNNTPTSAWAGGTSSGTVIRWQNGVLQTGGSYWNSWIRPSQLNIYDISNTVNWPTSATHTLGGMTGNPARGWDGRIYRIVAYDSVLSSDDRNSLLSYFKATYQKKRIIFSGDSLTLGTGASNQSTAYPAIARGLIGNPYSYWVSAVSGYAIQNLTTLVDPTTIHTQSPHAVVVWAGANNFAVLNETAGTAKTNLNSNVELHKTANPGVKVFVCTLLPDNQAVTGNAANYRSQAPSFNAAIVADADYSNGVRADGIIRLDQITELQDASNTTYFFDGLHLTDAGYALVGAEVAAFINEQVSV